MIAQIFLQAYQHGFLSECISVFGRLLVTKWSRYVCHFRPHDLAPTIEYKVGAHNCNGRDVLQKVLELDGLFTEFMEVGKSCLVLTSHIPSVGTYFE